MVRRMGVALTETYNVVLEFLYVIFICCCCTWLLDKFDSPPQVCNHDGLLIFLFMMLLPPKKPEVLFHRSHSVVEHPTARLARCPH